MSGGDSFAGGQPSIYEQFGDLEETIRREERRLKWVDQDLWDLMEETAGKSSDFARRWHALREERSSALKRLEQARKDLALLDPKGEGLYTVARRRRKARGKRS